MKVPKHSTRIVETPKQQVFYAQACIAQALAHPHRLGVLEKVDQGERAGH